MFEPETQLTSWFAIAVVMLTTSLLFYHMTRIRKPSLEVHPYVAAFIASGLILTDLMITITALVPYNVRFDEMLKLKEDNVYLKEGVNVEHEKAYRVVYTILISFFLLLQMVVCGYVIKDAFDRVRKTTPKVGKKRN